MLQQWLHTCFFDTSKSLNAARRAQRSVDGVTLQHCMQRESDRRVLADPLQREHFALSLEESDAIVFSM